MDNKVQELETRIKALERENKMLKQLLEKAGINYVNNHPKNNNGNVSKEMANMFFSYFWGRMDVFSKRSENKSTGKAAYYPQCDNFWKPDLCPKTNGEKIKCKDCQNCSWTRLEPKHIIAHLNGYKEDGSDVVGIYPLLEDGTCRFIVFDFDNHESSTNNVNDSAKDSWMEEVQSLRQICEDSKLPILVERSRSGNGAHIWLFFEKPIDANLARRFGYAILEKGAESVNLKNFKYYDRMLPAQDDVSGNGIGNLIALPLQGRALKNGNSAFVDGDWNTYDNQWDVLFKTRKISYGDVKDFVDKYYREENNLYYASSDNKPWIYSDSFHGEDVKGEVHITLANRIYIKTDNLKPRIQNQIRRLAAFSNPIYFRNKAIGLSNYASSRYIYLGFDENGYICIPRGLLASLTERLDEVNIDYTISDERCSGRHIAVSFNGELYPVQQHATDKLTEDSIGILSAATAFGKTVVASNIISRKKTNTLVLLESSSLVDQWKNSLERFLTINEEIPEYKTKTGRVKKRKELIGVIQGQKDTSAGIIDIAMIGSLMKHGKPHHRLKEYGMVIVDECHHAASDTFREVLEEINAKYVYGFTATPLRGDGLEKINYMLLGPVKYRYTSKEKAESQNIEHCVIPRFTRTIIPYRRESLDVNRAYEIVREDEGRNELICSDVKECILNRRTPVILTRFTEHASVLGRMLDNAADNVFVLTGEISKKQQKSIREAMNNVSRSESMILIATGQLIGEGFDFPRLDTLFIAMPIAWKGLVEQYAGRLNRDYPDKRDVLIFDYVDINIPVFDKMYVKRMKAYGQIGYKLLPNPTEGKTERNAIYDIDSYKTTYENDLLSAGREIVISSPTFSSYKVKRIIELLKEKQEQGVKVTISTWDSDYYTYGYDEKRLKNIEILRNAGFHIEFLKENCQCFAIIDRETVWYGSINLLSKEDIDDNIMRLNNKDIALELLEMTFSK